MAGPGAATINAGAGAETWIAAGTWAIGIIAGDDEIARDPGADEIAYPAGSAEGLAAIIVAGAPAAWIVVSAIGIAEALMQTTNAMKQIDVANWK